MTTAEALATLYRICKEQNTPFSAGECLCLTVAVAVGNIVDENLPMTPEEIQKRLVCEVEEYDRIWGNKNGKSIA